MPFCNRKHRFTDVFVTGWLNGLSSGFAILVSQWFGAKQYDKMRHYVAMSIYLAAGLCHCDDHWL